MASIRAVINQEKGNAIVADVGIPKLRDDYFIIKVKAVALNPTDWKHIEFLAVKGNRIGCDYAGVVEEVGSKVTKPFKKGDRVAGFVHGGNAVHPEDGAFAEYITAKGDIQMKIPDNLSFEEASTLGVGISTVGQVLYQSLGFPLPGEPPVDKTPLLIYGGSTATGSLAIQYAKLSGVTVITTCSPRSFDYVKSLGADAIFDYNSPTVIADIKTFAHDNLAHVVDCISQDDSIKISAGAMRPAGGIFSALLRIKPELVTSINPNVKVNCTLAYSIFGESYKMGPTDVPAVPEDFECGKKFWELSTDLLESGKIKVHRPAVNKYGAGLDGVLKGLAALKEGQVSGEKLVFTL